MLNKIKGGLFGLAIGDALGGTTEFMTPQEIHEKHGQVTEILGGGYWGLEPGETTDDTAMTIAVAKGILQNSDHPIEEIGKEFFIWFDTNPKDVGITIQTVFNLYNGSWPEAAEKAHIELNDKSAGNGSLMRCLPVALTYADSAKMEDITFQQSKMTHYDPIAAETCIIYNRIASRLLFEENLKHVIEEEVSDTIYEKELYQKPDCPPDGYVVHTMKWVLYWLLTCKSFEEVIIGATNLGNDSDTIAAIAGGLKGIEVGYNQLPHQYIDILLLKDELNSLAHQLFEKRV